MECKTLQNEIRQFEVFIEVKKSTLKKVRLEIGLVLEMGYSIIVKKYFDVGRGNVIVIRVGGIRRQPSDGPGRYAVSAVAAHID